MHLVSPEFERELVRKIMTRDGKAWAIFYNCFFDTIYEYVFYRVRRNHAVTEDIVQSAFLLALESIENYNSTQATLYTWLKGITNHQIFRYYRGSKKLSNLSLLSEEEIEKFVNQIDTNPIPREKLEQEELRRFVQSTLKALPAHYRDILVKKYFEDKTLKEIAQAYAKSAKSIEMIIYRAKEAFRKAYNRISKGQASQK